MEYRRKRERVASVYYRPFATFFYKHQSGDWKGPGGYYGPDSEIGKQLEEILKEQESK